jgi:hypothetical protein
MMEAYNVRTYTTTKSYEMWKGGSVNTIKNVAKSHMVCI